MKKKQCSGGNAYKSMSSGLSVKRWCKENHVSSPSFYYWKKRLEKKQSETSEETMPVFVEVTQTAPLHSCICF